MKSQASFLVLAPIAPTRAAQLRELLTSMNLAPGRVNPENALFPFAKFDTIHVARFLIVDDPTLQDIFVAYHLPVPTFPLFLAFAGDIDGDEAAFLELAATRAADGLRAIFSCCEDFSTTTDLAAWMKRHRAPASANYVNWRGRTVPRVREEAALHERIEAFLDSDRSRFTALPAAKLHAVVRDFVRSEISANRLTLSPDSPTMIVEAIENAADFVAVPLILLLASPLLLIVGALALLRLQQAEENDPELCGRTDLEYSLALAAIEDHDVTNQFTAMGSLKPGLLRKWATVFVLWIIDWGARHLFTRGRLARVRSIHFARWVFLDGGRRLLFLSNYDGSLESYMDDFINKVGFGLNVVFTHGIGYPRTRWLLLGGCSDERKFKEYLRRHQLPTQVWYKAYPGLTAVDLERNTRIREGVESVSLSEEEARKWVALL